MRKHAINALVLLVALLVALLLAEVIARCFLSPPEIIAITSKPAAAATVLPTGDKQQLTIAEHPDEGGLYRGTPTGRRLNPDRVVTIEHHRLSKQRVLIETNSIGYRNPEIGPRPADPHYRRILFLGDSITFQDFLNEPDTFVRLIEQQARAQGRHWETINSGVGAISLKTELAILEESGLALQPDVVVLDFYLNDFQESKGVTILRLPTVLQHSWFLYHLDNWLSHLAGSKAPGESAAVNLPQWQQQFEQQTQFANGPFNANPQAFNSMVRDNFADYGAAWSPQAWNYMRPLFAELKRLSLEHHFQLVIVGFPIYQQVYSEFATDYPQQQLQRVGAELGIPVLDLLPPLRAEAVRLRDPSIYHAQQPVQDLFYDQCHHTAVGSHFIAGQMYNFLQGQVK